MTKIRPLETMILMFAMALLAGLAALVVLGLAQQTALPAMQQQVEIPWSEIEIPANLRINEHASKHLGQQLDAWKIYAMLLEGQCVDTAVFCGPSDIERLYLCDSLTGLIGGIFVDGDEIHTGFGARLKYWENQLAKPKWEVCDD